MSEAYCPPVEALVLVGPLLRDSDGHPCWCVRCRPVRVETLIICVSYPTELNDKIILENNVDREEKLVLKLVLEPPLDAQGDSRACCGAAGWRSLPIEWQTPP